MTKTIKIPRGAPTGPDGRPIYGWSEVTADCKGGLCVHKDVSCLAIWRVTHEASGLGVPFLQTTSQARALRIRDAALGLAIDWGADEAAVTQAIRPFTETLKAIGTAE